MIDEVGRLGLGSARHVEVLVDLQATNLLARGQEIELVAGDTAAAERGDDIACGDRLEGNAAVPLVGGSGRPRLWSEKADTHPHQHGG